MTTQLEEAWIGFFATAAGASGSLVGLVIVAISVNLQRIMMYRHLPLRAGAAVGSLVVILVSSMAALVPQPLAALAIEILGFGLVVWSWQIWTARRMFVASSAHGRPLRETVVGIVIGQLQVIPFIIGGASLLIGQGGGIYWIAAGVITTFVLSVLNAWVLLVEILR